MAQPTQPTPLQVRKGIDIIYKWVSPERIWKPKSQVWYLTSAAVILFFILLATRLGYLTVIIALVAFLFMWFIYGTVAPWEVEHKITSKGIFTHNVMYRWEDIAYFWMAQKDEWILLHFDFFPEKQSARLTLLLPKNIQEEVFRELIQYEKYGEKEEVGFNFLSRIIYGEYIPISKFIVDLDEQQALTSTQKPSTQTAEVNPEAVQTTVN